MSHKLEVSHLSKIINKRKIIEDVSLEINSGEVVGLLGPNGAGKTTSFYMICGLIEATSGEVLLDGVDISKLSLSQRAKAGIGYLPQEASIFKDLTVRDNILLATEIFYKDRREQLKRVNRLMEMFNISHIKHSMGLSLSGGERRRCEIARALAITPKFLLLDEPFAGVDPIAVADIQKTIKSLAKLGIGILITDHNVRETLNICDKAYVIKEGNLLASGTAEEIFNNELVKKYYLGENFKM